MLAGPDAAQALALDAKALSGLKREAHANPAQALAKAAGQFEAMFLQMVLKQMRETLPRDGPLDSDAMRTYTSMFDQQIAQQLAGRGLGLREAIERQLARALPPAPGTADARAAPTPPAGPPPAVPGAPDALRRIGARIEGSLRDAPAARSPPAPAATTRVESFVARVRPYAEAAAAASGIPAPLLIAQAGLETGWGRSQPRTADGAVSHNLFGIKAGGRWTGASVAATTTEYVRGIAVRTVERFRAYASPLDAFRDFARLLSGERYAQARASAQAHDGAAYARHLQQAGYATDPRYADKLTRAIDMVHRQLAVPAAVGAGAPAAPAPAGIQVPSAAADKPFDRTAS